MIVNEVITGIVAIVVAYLIGSIPFAYIVTRLATGQDIRRLGSGNVGGNNVRYDPNPASPRISQAASLGSHSPCCGHSSSHNHDVRNRISIWLAWILQRATFPLVAFPA